MSKEDNKIKQTVAGINEDTGANIYQYREIVVSLYWNRMELILNIPRTKTLLLYVEGPVLQHQKKVKRSKTIAILFENFSVYPAYAYEYENIYEYIYTDMYN